MDLELKGRFLSLWAKYFGPAELPITLYYTEDEGRADKVEPGTAPRCLIEALIPVRHGRSLAFGTDSVGCFGARRYLGFTDKIRPDFEYFLSCGIPGKLEGERYKKTPELVRELVQRVPFVPAPARYAIFKRWDCLDGADHPEVVAFFATPDVVAGLFTLANFDEADPNAVIAPMGAGCATIVQRPLVENSSEHPNAVLGMFDISARPFVPAEAFSFAVPMRKFVRMIDNMEESFLTTGSWQKVQPRIRPLSG